MRNLLTTCAMLLSISLFAQATQAPLKNFDTVIVQNNVSVGTIAPTGWTLDSEAANGLGICSLYVLKGFNFDNSPAILYPRISDETYKDDQGIENVVRQMSQLYKSKSTKFELKTHPDVKTAQGLTFVVREFLNGPSPNNFEKVAYVKIGKVILISVYSAKDFSSFQKHKKALDEFLEKVTSFQTDLKPLSGRCLSVKK